MEVATAPASTQQEVVEEEEELDFETVPASWTSGNAASNHVTVPSADRYGHGEEAVLTAQEVSSPAQQRLERFSSLARGNSTDGMRHSR